MAGGLLGLVGAGVTFLLLVTWPDLALRLDFEVPWWMGLSAIGLLLVLTPGFFAAVLPRSCGKVILQFALSALLGLGGLLVVYPPCLGWLFMSPITYPLGTWLQGFSSRSDDPYRELEYETRGLMVRSGRGREWVLSPENGRVVEARGPGSVDCRRFHRKPVRPRDLDLNLIRSGVPIQILQSSREVEGISRFDGPPSLVTNDGKHFVSRNNWFEVWRVRDGRLLFEAPSGNLTSIPGGTLVVIEEPLDVAEPPCFPRLIYVDHPIPNLPPPRLYRRRISVVDTESGRELWKRIVEGWSLRPSPQGSYLAAGSQLFDSHSGEDLGSVGGPIRFWSSDERWVLIGGEGEKLQAVRVPEVIGCSPPRNLTLEHGSFNECTLRPNGSQLALADGDRVRLYSFPDLHLQSDTLLLHPEWLTCRACAIGAGIGAAALFLSLVLPCGRGRGAIDGSSRSGSGFGKTVIAFYLLLCPLCVLLAGLLPIHLSDGLGGASFLLITGFAIPMAFRSICRWKYRLLAAAMLLGVPVLALFSTLFLTTKICGQAPCSEFKLIDDRMVIDTRAGRLREIGSGCEGSELEPINLQTRWMSYETADGVLRGRYGDFACEWSLENGSLVRAAIEPAHRAVSGDGWTWFSGGYRVGDRVVPLATIMDAHSVQKTHATSDGRVLYVKGTGSTIFQNRLSQLRYLELPLHAALGAILLTLILRGLGRLLLFLLRLG